MKKYLFISLILIIIIASIFFINQKENSIASNITIKLACDNSLPPFEFVENNILKGFNIDIARAISIDRGIDIEIVPMNWFDALLKLEHNEVDGILGMKETDIRKQKYSFSNPYIITSHGIFVRSDNSYISELSDLSGLTIGIQKNDISESLIKNIKNIHIIRYENQEKLLEALIQKNIDAYIGNRVTGAYNVQKHNYESVVKIVGDNLIEENYCFATQKENNEFLEILNIGIKNIKDNGSYDKIYNKWFGKQFTYNKNLIKKIIIIFAILFLSVFVLILIILKWNFSLSKNVEHKTKELENEYKLKEKILNSIVSDVIVIDENKNIKVLSKKTITRFHCNEGDNLNNTIFYKIIDFSKINTALNEFKIVKNTQTSLFINNSRNYYSYYLRPIMLSDTEKGVIITIMNNTEEILLKNKYEEEERLNTLGRLTASISHEIKNPLTAIKTYVSLLDTKFNNENFRQKFSKDVNSELIRLENYLDNVLNFSKPKSREKEIIHLTEVLNFSVSFVESQARKQKVDFYYDIDENIYIYANENSIKQIFLNLIMNAFDAVKDVEKACVNLNTEIEDQTVKIIIRDNGIGFKTEDINKIFTPYYSTKKDGIGLGLTITKDMIEKSDGKIFVKREEDITEFIVVFEVKNV